MKRLRTAWSVVIPTLDEESTLPRVLKALEDWGQDTEVLVADGASRDRTVRIARDLGARVLEAPRGRASQMNAGAAAARGDRLLFLHADTVPPRGARQAATDLLDRPGVVAGCFPVRFESPHPLLWGAAWKTHLWVRVLGFAPGDHGLFLRRHEFERAGGFPDLPILEDRHICRALRKRGRIEVAPVTARASARRFHRQGVLRTYVRMLRVLMLDRKGASPERLEAVYCGNPR